MQAAEFSGNKAKRGGGVFINSQQYDPVLTVSALGADKQPVLIESVSDALPLHVAGVASCPRCSPWVGCPCMRLFSMMTVQLPCV